MGGSTWRDGEDDGLLMVEDVCPAIRVSNMTVYRLIKWGELPAIRLGKTYRVLASGMERYLPGLVVRVEAE